MARTSRHIYQLAARVLLDPSLELQDFQRSAVANRFADEFERDNPRFRRDLFFADCDAMDLTSLEAHENYLIGEVRWALERSVPDSGPAAGDPSATVSEETTRAPSPGRIRGFPQSIDSPMPSQGGNPSGLTNSRLIGSGDASPAQALDEFRNLFGDHRIDQLAELKQPLSTWLEDQPDAWVRVRRAQLGPPGQGLNRGNARRALLLEAQRTRLEERVNRARKEGKQLEDRADAIWEAKLRGKIIQPAKLRDQVEALDAMAQAEFQEADKVAVMLDRVKQRDHELRQQGHDLDSLIARHGTQLVLSAAYTDDYERRRAKHIAQGIDAALDKPSHDIVGPRPDKASPHYPEWAAITRTVESARLATEFDRPDSIEQPTADPQPSVALTRRIHRLHTERAIEPRAHEYQVEPAMQADGLDPF